MEVIHNDVRQNTYVRNENGEKVARAIVLTEDGMCLTAFWSRLLCGFGLEEKFNPILVMENVIPLFDKSFNYKIVDFKEWHWSIFQPAFYNPERNEIIIRSDTYENALAGNTMDIITIAHEVSHCIQSIVLRILNAMQCVEFKTELCKINSEEMSHHELQTDRITSLILSPSRLTEGKSDDEILEQYFVKPLMQIVIGIIKAVGKEFLDSLSKMPVIVKEVEKCAV